MIDYDDYKRWKPDYIETEYQKLKNRRHLITVYFRGVDGQNYQETTAQKLAIGILQEIEEREDLIFAGLGNATEEETRQFIAEMAWDEDLRDVHFESPHDRKLEKREETCVDLSDFPYGVDEELPFD